MQPISGLAPGAAQSPAAVNGVKEVLKAHRPEGEGQGRPLRPLMDEYVPEKKREPSGLYWGGRGEDGKPKIYFDDPERAEDNPKQSEDTPNQGIGAGATEKSGSDKNVEQCTVSTDKVDREIEKLKKKKQELEQQINRETDETKVKDLKAKLAQVEKELNQKDNDTYRRQHAVYTFS